MPAGRTTGRVISIVVSAIRQHSLLNGSSFWNWLTTVIPQLLTDNIPFNKLSPHIGLTGLMYQSQMGQLLLNILHFNWLWVRIHMVITKEQWLKHLFIVTQANMAQRGKPQTLGIMEPAVHQQEEDFNHLGLHQYKLRRHERAISRNHKLMW